MCFPFSARENRNVVCKLYFQVLSNKIAIARMSTAMVVRPVHVLLMCVSLKFWLWSAENSLMQPRFLNVTREINKVMKRQERM